MCSFLDTTSHLRLATCSRELDERLHHAAAWSADITFCVDSFARVTKSWTRLGLYLRPRALVLEQQRSYNHSEDSIEEAIADAVGLLVGNMRSLETLTTQFTLSSAQWSMLEDKPKLRVLDTYVSPLSTDDLKALATLRNRPPLEKISPLRVLVSDNQQLGLLANLQLPLVQLTLLPSYGARFAMVDKLSLMPLSRMRDTLRSLLLRDTSSETVAGAPRTQRLLAAALTTEGSLNSLEELGEFTLETLEPELAAAIRARSKTLRHVHFGCLASVGAKVWDRLIPDASMLQLTRLTTLTVGIREEYRTRTDVEEPAVWQGLAAFILRATPNLSCLRIPIRFWRPGKRARIMASNVELVLRAATQLKRFECGCRQDHDTDLRALVQQVASSLGLRNLVVAACDIS